MRVRRRKRWAIACLLAGPLRVRQGAKAPYSGRATKWSVPTAEHRHSQGHYRGRREESFLSLKRKCPPEQECLYNFSPTFLLPLFMSLTSSCLNYHHGYLFNTYGKQCFQETLLTGPFMLRRNKYCRRLLLE